MDLIALFGRFHPVVLHLPIGAMFTILVVEIWLAWRKQAAASGRLLFTMNVFALLTCVLAIATGLALHQEPVYGGTTLDRHEDLGYFTGAAVLSLVVFSFLARTAESSKIWTTLRRLSVILSLLLITAAGHLGGEMTHGRDFLTEFAPAWFREEAEEMDIAEVVEISESSTVFETVIEPIIFTNCAYCHDEETTKGGLRMDSHEFMLAGGKSGDLFVAGNSSESLMIQRMLLPLEDEDRMPPSNKQQPDSAEVDALSWWVESGASVELALEDPIVPEFIRAMVTPIEDEVQEQIASVIKENLDIELLRELRSQHLSIQRIEQASDRLWIDFSAVATTAGDPLIEQLEPLSNFIVWLNVSRSQVTDASMEIIGNMPRLEQLDLRNTSVSNLGLLKLSNLSTVKRLNLTGTRSSLASFGAIHQLAPDAKVYLYDTAWTPEGVQELKEARPDLEIFFD